MNLGAEALQRALPKHGDQAVLARELGVNPATISRWLRGTLTPGVAHRASLSERFGIDWRSWDRAADDDPPESGRTVPPEPQTEAG